MAVPSSVYDPYVSRIDSSCELAVRKDPVCWGEAETPLSQSKLDEYANNGYLFFPELFSETEVSEMCREAEDIAARWPDGKPGLVREPGSETVRSVFMLHHVSRLYRKVFEDPRLLGPIRQLLGSDAYLQQTRINYKLPFDGKEFFWHSDFETWHCEDGMPRMRAISLSLFLTESHEFNGPLMLVPGSHHQYVRCAGETPEKHYQQSLRKQEYGVPSREALKELIEDGGIVAPKGSPGSAVLFECNTMHGSTGNLSPFPRINLFAVYNSVENQLQEPFCGRPPRPNFLAERNAVPLQQTESVSED